MDNSNLIRRDPRYHTTPQKGEATMSKVHAIITQKIIAELENGNIPWKRPWKTSGLLPTNLVSRKAYRGINTLLLSLSGFESPYWLTFKQSKALGGSVRKGEKGSIVVFYTDYSKENSAGEVETLTCPPKTGPVCMLKFWT